MLPEIKSSSEVYGEVRSGGKFNGVKIAGDLGDQQAATFGQACFGPARRRTPTARATSSCSTRARRRCTSKNGLLTTVGYKIGDQDAVYCLEGAIAITGALVQWLRDNLKMIKAAPEVEELAQLGRRQRRLLLRPGVLAACSRRTGSPTPAASSPA